MYEGVLGEFGAGVSTAPKATPFSLLVDDRGVIVGDALTGTSKDGINPRGLNLNEGAESVLAWQLASCAIARLRAKGRPVRG